MAIGRNAAGHKAAKNLVSGVGVVTLTPNTLHNGSTLVLAIQTDSNAPDSVKYGSVSFTLVATSADTFLRIYELQNITVTGANIVVDMTSTTAAYIAFSVIEITGAVTSNPRDILQPSSGSSTTFASASSGTLAQANELVLVFYGDQGPSTDTLGAPSNGFTAGQKDGTSGGTANLNATINDQFLIVSSTSAVSTSSTNSISRAYDGFIVSYKEAASTPGKVVSVTTTYDYGIVNADGGVAYSSLASPYRDGRWYYPVLPVYAPPPIKTGPL